MGRRGAIAAGLAACAAAWTAAPAGATEHDPELPRQGPPVQLPPDRASGRECPTVPSQRGLVGDASADAQAGPAPLFRRVHVPGVADNDNGGPRGALPALVDLDKDGRTDIVLTRSATLKLFLNRGCLEFAAHPLEIVDSAFSGDRVPGPNLGGTTFADFNDDGLLDPYLTGTGGGNELLLSQGRFDRFKDATEALGVSNAGAYSRQSQIGDVNGDGYLDIAVGADQIGTPDAGKPYQRLYVYDPAAGRFNDVGGTPLVPNFGGAPNCDPRHDRQSPGILLRDLAGDGALDLVQGYHNDMNLAMQHEQCVTGERDYGIFAWRNLSPALGRLQFDHVGAGANGLTDLGRMRYDYLRQDYEVLQPAVGLPYIVAFDAFNTGRLDLLAIGPTDPEWHVNSDMIAGRFFRNLGGFQFEEATDEAGLEALNWTYGDWAEFWDAPSNPSKLAIAACAISNRRPTCLPYRTADHQFYMASAVWADVNNDGNVDVLISDRHEDADNSGTLRNVLFLNNGRGFEPTTSQVSGLDTNTISLEAADLTGDGLVDLVAGVQPSGSNPLARDGVPGFELPAERSYTKVYVNDGALGGRRNHWVELRLTGLPDRLLIGSQLELTASRRDGRRRRYLGRRDLFPADAFKASHDLIAHWGLGRRPRARVAVRLPSGRRLQVALPCVDARLTLNVRTRRVGGCRRTR